MQSVYVKTSTEKKDRKVVVPVAKIFSDGEWEIRVGIVGVVTDFVNLWEKAENLEQIK